jgi:hypothetical protein
MSTATDTLEVMIADLHAEVENDAHAGMHDSGAARKQFVLLEALKAVSKAEIERPAPYKTHWSLQFRRAPGMWTEGRIIHDRETADGVFGGIETSIENTAMKSGEAWRLVEVISTVIAQTKESPQ